MLSVGSEAWLSHRTAAAVRGLRPVNLRAIELTLPGTGARSHATLTVHRRRSEPHRDDVRVHQGMRVSSVPRLLVELAPRETPEELARLIHEAVVRRALPLDTAAGRARLEACLARHPRHAGAAKLREALAGYRPAGKSGLERAFAALMARHPEIPEPVRNVHIDRWEIDCLWPAQKLVVELDGRPYHVAVRDMERDRIKDAALQRLGFTPLRYTDTRVEHDAGSILGDLRHFLGLGPEAAPAPATPGPGEG